MNYTKNHHLPQWVKSDRIRMEDFNNAMSRIESGLTANASAASDAKTAAQAAANAAAEASSSAAAKADAALTAAQKAFSPDNLPFAVGSYTGTGENMIVDLGFAPSFMIVSGMQESSTENDFSPFLTYFAMTSNNANVRCRLQLIHYGFVVYPAGNHDRLYPNLNEAGRHYDYIAFK